jgi:serine/threonine-protein kinase
MVRVSKLAAALMALVALPAWSQEYFGAIAYSPSTRAHGWAKDHPSREAAEHAALSGCSKHADDCSTVLWFKNACGALATGPKGAGWAWDQVQSVADQGAISACAKHSTACTVKRRVCTTR